MTSRLVPSLTLCVLVFSFGNVAKALDCLDLYVASLGVAIHTFNIENSDVCRTPDGGPYKRIEIVRSQTDFRLVPHSDFKMIYEPGHPDANSDGMVTYPNIDSEKEKIAATAAAHDLRLLASNHVCGTSLEQDGDTAFIHYDQSLSFRVPEIESDTLVFNDQGNLKLWSRRSHSGPEYSHRF